MMTPVDALLWLLVAIVFVAFVGAIVFLVIVARLVLKGIRDEPFSLPLTPYTPIHPKARQNGHGRDNTRR